MCKLYLYAIVDDMGGELPELAGLGDTALAGLAAGGLLAVVSRAPQGEVPLTRANLLRHEQVVEALMAERGVLPARFGTTASDHELVEALERHGPELAQSLERVRGRVELALRVIDPAANERPPARPSRAAVGDGRGYMQALLEAERQQARLRAAMDEIAGQISAALAPLADGSTQSSPEGRQLLKAAYLVRREGLEALRRGIDAQRAAHPGLAFLATGPWPAYSFTGIERGLGYEEGEGR
jgi:hypothetical protein